MTDDPKKKNDARSVILARRARFVAAAMASISIACGKDDKKPEPCLSAVAIDASVEPNALADAIAPIDAGADPVDASTDATSTADASPVDAGLARPNDAGPRPCLEVTPRPCLSVTPRPCLTPPRPCLKVAPKDPNDPLL